MAASTKPDYMLEFLDHGTSCGMLQAACRKQGLASGTPARYAEDDQEIRLGRIKTRNTDKPHLRYYIADKKVVHEEGSGGDYDVVRTKDGCACVPRLSFPCEVFSDNSAYGNVSQNGVPVNEKTKQEPNMKRGCTYGFYLREIPDIPESVAGFDMLSKMEEDWDNNLVSDKVIYQSPNMKSVFTYTDNEGKTHTKNEQGRRIAIETERNERTMKDTIFYKPMGTEKAKDDQPGKKLRRTVKAMHYAFSNCGKETTKSEWEKMRDAVTGPLYDPDGKVRDFLDFQQDKKNLLLQFVPPKITTAGNKIIPPAHFRYLNGFYGIVTIRPGQMAWTVEEQNDKKKVDKNDENNPEFKPSCAKLRKFVVENVKMIQNKKVFDGGDKDAFDCEAETKRIYEMALLAAKGAAEDNNAALNPPMSPNTRLEMESASEALQNDMRDSDDEDGPQGEETQKTPGPEASPKPASKKRKAAAKGGGRKKTKMPDTIEEEEEEE